MVAAEPVKFAVPAVAVVMLAAPATLMTPLERVGMLAGGEGGCPGAGDSAGGDCAGGGGEADIAGIGYGTDGEIRSTDVQSGAGSDGDLRGGGECVEIECAGADGGGAGVVHGGGGEIKCASAGLGEAACAGDRGASLGGVGKGGIDLDGRGGALE